MAAVTSTSPALPYSRRVSFNNLQSDELESGGPPDVTRFHSYTMASKESAPKSHDPELSKLFGNYSLSSPSTSFSRKRLKLPEPPSKSILKNKLSQDQLRVNIAHAIELGAAFNKELNDLVNNPPESVPKSELARVIHESDSQDAEDYAIDSDDDSPLRRPPEGRRKSLSGLTDEELMALDPQFAKPNKSDLKDFKFDSIGSSYSTSRRGSTSGMHLTTPSKGTHVLYPSSNENNYKSVSFTVKHKDFENEEISPRTILTVISGRKHTWNTLDWLLLTDDQLKETPGFLQNGDHLVVAALVPLKYLQNENKGSTRKKDSGERKVQKKCEEILSYILASLPDPEIRLKITVELVMDVPYPDPMTISASASKRVQTGTKFMMSHLFKQYQPTLLAIGNKSTSLNFKYPRRMSKGTTSTSTTRSSISAGATTIVKPADPEVEKYLVKLSSYLIRYSTVPVIMAGNTTVFHRKPISKVVPSVTFTDPGLKKGILDVPQDPLRHNSIGSDGSIESFFGEQSNEVDSDSLTAQRHSESPPSQVDCPTDPFAAMISEISVKSLTESRTYLEQIKADKIPPHFADNKVHQAYVSMEQGRQNSLSKTNSSGAPGRAYRVKSLISYSEEDEKKNEKMISDKKLKKSNSRNSAGSSISGGSEDKQVKKKKSFLQKIGLKKG